MGVIKYTPEMLEEAKSLKKKLEWLEVAARVSKKFNLKVSAEALRRAVKIPLELRQKEEPSLAKFLQKGRTLKEIKDKFGEVDLTPPEGLTLFEQRNDFNEPVYIYLPITNNDIEIKPREWDLKVSKESPYIWAQFKDSVEEIKIVPIFDVHYGNVGHKHEKFLSYIRWIEETPGVYAVIGGDLMENALDDGRGYSYDQNFQPETQMLDMVKFLAPIAHKIICMTPGNHELRTRNKAGIDPTMYIADQLKVPYFSGPIVVDFLWKGFRWGAHVFHGNSNSQTKGGKHNAASRAVKWTENLQFYISGHVHDPMVNSETRLVRDVTNFELSEQTYWIMIAPSFLQWNNTYAYRANYAPPGKGGVSAVLYPNGDYKAYLT